MTNPFTAHPASVEETYFRRCRLACRFGARMLARVVDFVAMLPPDYEI